MPKLLDILSYALKNGAPDIHLTVGSKPACRADGEIRFFGDHVLTPRDTFEFLDDLMDPGQKELFLDVGDADLAIGFKDLGRFRVNVLRQRGSVGIVLRHVRGQIVPLDQLNLPLKAVNRISSERRGLVLITGATGSGKSMTTAAVIDRINETRHDHIVTLEDPIEFLHTNKNSIVTQREVHIDTKDFPTGIRAALREDPDVILIGEMRDDETFRMACEAAETGHLVFSTLHTTNAILTIERIFDMFLPQQQELVRSQLALQLRATMAQRLVPAVDEGTRVAAVEVMFNNPGIQQLIRENAIKHLQNAIIAGRDEGMQTFNMSLVTLIQHGLVAENVAMEFSDNREELAQNLKGVYQGSDNPEA